MRSRSLAIAAIAACAVATAFAIVRGETQIRVLGWFGNQPQIDDVELCRSDRLS